jgi:hypothetical protein
VSGGNKDACLQAACLQDGSLREMYGQLLRDPVLFAEAASGVRLRSYQRETLRAIVDSTIHKLGLAFVVVFPRQSGKNELQAHLEAYLLVLLSRCEAEIVKASPTWKPQTLNAMRRLERVLSRNAITAGRWVKETGYIYRFQKARVIFLSAEPGANVVGATANPLLECDEAQAVLPAKWDRDFAPMAASTQATRVFWGTAWTGRTLLMRELHAARQLEQSDGQRRVFHLAAGQVAQEVPAYGRFVAEQVARLGRDHPLVKSQYFSEEIDASSGMFPERRLALMRGGHLPVREPRPGAIYCLLVDVAGEDEGAQLPIEEAGSLHNPRRDSTAATLVEIDLATQADPLVQAPTYRVQARYTWTGAKHSQLYPALCALARRWDCRHIVIDASGLGEGLASFLEKAFPGRVLPVRFSARSKSELGWKFLAAVETGRYQEPLESAGISGEFWSQARHCQAQAGQGPGHPLRWGVPDGTRDPLTGEPVHDDLLLSAALVGVLDGLDWSLGGAPLVVPGADPLQEIDAEGF